MAGKNKLERGVTIDVDDSGTTARDLTADLVPGSLNGLGFTAGEVDMTGVGQDKNYLADVKDNTLSCQFHMNNTATTGASTVLNGIVGGAAGTVTIQIGEGGAAPTTGDLQFAGEFVLIDNTISVDGGKLVHNCTFRPSGSTPPAWTTI